MKRVETSTPYIQCVQVHVYILDRTPALLKTWAGDLPESRGGVSECWVPYKRTPSGSEELLCNDIGVDRTVGSSR